MGDDTKDTLPSSRGTIIRAENGDVLRYDSTGLVMVLSDSVIANIAQRLPDNETAAKDYGWIDPNVLGDIDAWDVRRDGEWYVFSANLPGAQGPRQFRRLVRTQDTEIDPGIVADGAGCLGGLFSIGGPRRATGFNGLLSYPWHIVSPADDLGAIGHSGAQEAETNSALEPVREITRDVVLADTMLARKHKGHRSLPLFMTRTETDSSSSVAALASGTAYENLLTALKSLQSAAQRLGRSPLLHAIGFEFTLEDVRSDAETYLNGVMDLLAALTSDIARLGMRRPPVLSVFDCGTHMINDHPVLRAQWELAWQGPEYGLCYTAPGYMFRQDRYGRPDQDALHHMAEMDACALETIAADETWFCPIFLLAERERDPKQIRIRARAMSDLAIDPEDPFGAGACCGFSVSGATNASKITKVLLAEDDPQDVILTFDTAPEGPRLEILYAFGMSPDRSGTDFPKACGSLRDTWSRKSHNGVVLHRWALPAVLPVW